MSIYLGLGSNLQKPERQIKTAIKELEAEKSIRVLKKSSLYQSKAWGNKNQPDFINAVVKIKTKMSPEKLLKVCRLIEDKRQRQRKEKWGARTLDIDILLFEDKVLNTESLTLPHPYLRKRAFVLVPLFEIARGLKLPPDNKSLKKILVKADTTGVKLID